MDTKEEKVVVVICPKCKIKLRIDDAKLTEQGTRFKCPKCSTTLLVKKPPAVSPKPVDNLKVLVAHSNPSTIDVIESILKPNGYKIITASDGIDAMVKAIKEMPFLLILEVSLPKIFGFEVCKRLKLRPEAKNMKFILVSSVHDDKRYRRQPESLYEADDYIEEHRLQELLLESVRKMQGHVEEPQKKEIKPEKPAAVPPSEEKVVPKYEPETVSEKKQVPPQLSDMVERARRLARAIVSDIYLYNTPKAEEAIKNNTFFSVFAAELREGQKLYDNRISQEVRAQGDFFKETIQEFIENKKKNL